MQRVPKGLVGAFGVSAAVVKGRERRALDRALFNLDTIEDVGRVLKAAMMLNEGESADEAQGYLDRFAPFLGERIEGSNKNLVRS